MTPRVRFESRADAAHQRGGLLRDGRVGHGEAVDAVMNGNDHPMGPLELADFIGLDVCVDIMHVLQEGLGDPKYRACPLLKKYVAAGLARRNPGGDL